MITEEFQNSKSRQEENVREMLDRTGDRDVLVFTDGSAWETQYRQEQGWWSTWMVTSQCKFF